MTQCSDLKIINQTRYSSEDILKLFAWFDKWTRQVQFAHGGGFDHRRLSDFWVCSQMRQLKISYLGSRHIAESDVNMSYPTLPGGFHASKLKAHLSITSPARLLSRQDPLKVLALSRNGQADYLDEETCREILRWYFSQGQMLSPDRFGFPSNWQGRKAVADEIIKCFEELSSYSLGPINDVGTVRNTARHKWPVVWGMSLSEWGKDMPSVKISNGIEDPPRKRSLEERVAHCREQFGDSSGVMSGGSKNPTCEWESRIKGAAWKYQQEWERQEKWRQKATKAGGKGRAALVLPRVPTLRCRPV